MPCIPQNIIINPYLIVYICHNFYDDCEIQKQFSRACYFNPFNMAINMSTVLINLSLFNTKKNT